MGIASLIATTIGIILLVIVAYVLVGGTLTVAEVVAIAQSDTIGTHETRLHTSIEITRGTVDRGASLLHADIENTGSETIGNFEQMDLFLLADGEPERYSYGTGPGTWSVNGITPDDIHPFQLDPNEVMNISVRYEGPVPTWVQVTTPLGVSASAYVMEG